MQCQQLCRNGHAQTCDVDRQCRNQATASLFQTAWQAPQRVVCVWCVCRHDRVAVPTARNAPPPAPAQQQQQQHKMKTAASAVSGQAAGSKQQQAALATQGSSRHSHGTALLLAVFVASHAALIGASLRSFYWTPPPKGAEAPAAMFSEARARQHVAVLTERIGMRSVSMPGLQEAHHYIWDFCQRLQAAAEADGGQLVVSAAFENYTGAFAFDFVGESFINAYHNISNIVLHISRRGPMESLPGVMLVAHHDSPVGSPGAGDDASNVGVMMELASNLVAAPDAFPSSPVMLLFSGAEEPLCQSAAAFMASSPWASRAGVFINLESIGPGGAPIVFQHAGAWTIEAFAHGAAHPRGAIAAQDIFDAGLVLGDTDFRQLSYRHRGGLPGIDVAYLLTGAAYHTDRDTLQAIRPGVLQETGETLTAAVRSLADALSSAAAAGDGRLDALLRPRDHKRMFFSVLGRFMLTYSAETANLLHTAPLVLVLSAPAALKLLHPTTALPPLEGVRVMVSAAGVATATLASVMLLPAGLGALRAWLSGKALIWFAHPIVALCSYYPTALAVLLWPRGGADYSRGGRDAALLPYHLLGPALMNSLVAAAVTRFAGTAVIFAMWGGAGVVAAFCVAQGVTLPSLLGALLASAAPIYIGAETGLVLSIVMMSRMSLTGHVFIGLGDAIVGLLMGLGCVATLGLSMLPVLQALLGRRARRLAAALAAAGVAVAAVSSAGGLLSPYSRDMPKRLMLGHVHYTAPAEGVPVSAPASANCGAAVPMRVVNSSWAIAGSDSNPTSWVAEGLGFDPTTAQAPSGNELGLIYPVSKLLDLQLYPAEPHTGLVGQLPHVRVLRRRRLGGPDAAGSAAGSFGGGGLVEVELEVFTEAACWGTLKLAGADIVGWSLVPGVWTDAAAFQRGKQRGSGSAVVTRGGSHGLGGSGGGSGDAVRSVVIKWTNELQQRPLCWPLVVRYRAPLEQQQAGQEQQPAPPPLLGVELHVGHVVRSEAVSGMVARMPPWSTLSFEATIFVSSWLV